MYGTSSASGGLLKQPWFIPVCILVLIIVVLQMMPSNDSPQLTASTMKHANGNSGLNELRAIVSAEVLSLIHI